MEEHCIKVCLKLCGEHASEEEVEAIHGFSEVLEEALETHQAGEFDGDEFGGGECMLYMYGPDADRMFEVIQEPLSQFSLASGGYVIKRYGPPVDGVRESKIEL
jgi:hypothetical protein